MRNVSNLAFKELVEHHPKAIMLAQHGPRIAYVNKQFTHVTGYELHEVVNQTPAMLSSGLHNAAFYQRMWQDIADKQRWEGLIWNRRKNGEQYPQWLTIYPLTVDHQTWYVGIFLDVHEARQQSDGLTNLAYFDPLTGLANRALFLESIHAYIHQYDLFQHPFALLFIDLDFFKEVNDLHGHAVGDQVLQAVAQRLQNCLPSDATLARLSGDEFAALIHLTPDTIPLPNVCQAVVDAFQQPIHVAHQQHYVTTSLGAALCPQHSQQHTRLLQQADRAMYSAKQAGKSCYRIYSEQDAEQTQRQQRIHEALRHALETAPEQFYVEYQPQYHLPSQTLTGLEALMRWHHPELGQIAPTEFIAIAEQRGLIHAVSECLVTRIIQDFHDQAKPKTPKQLAINISAQQINDTRLMSLLRPLHTCLQRCGWQLEVEITESMLMSMGKSSLQRLHALRDEQIRLAIDDFGTGYSSLVYLQNLPVDTLKIDRHFIQQMDANDDQRIVSAILSLAKSLHLSVLAEGIETHAQLQTLQALQCPLGQGYWFSKPTQLDSLSAALLD